MKAVFQGERNAASSVIGLASVYDNHIRNYTNNEEKSDCVIIPGEVGGGRKGARPERSVSRSQLCTPPGQNQVLSSSDALSEGTEWSGAGVERAPPCYSSVAGWLEVWDYVGGNSFRGFISNDVDGEKSIFIFFDYGVVGRDLKQALVALIELADAMLASSDNSPSNLVICVDRRVPEEEALPLMKGLQWAGFSLTTLDKWTGMVNVDVTSPEWIFMSMEV